MKKLLVALAAAALASAALAQTPPAFPSKAIAVIVPTAAGGGNDAMAHTIAQLAALVKSELVKWKRVVQQAKLTAE